MQDFFLIPIDSGCVQVIGSKCQGHVPWQICEGSLAVLSRLTLMLVMSTVVMQKSLLGCLLLVFLVLKCVSGTSNTSGLVTRSVVDVQCHCNLLQ